MKKTFKTFLRNFKQAVEKTFAPYFVLNKNTGGKHFAWSKKDALEWAKMYDSEAFGIVHVRNTYSGKVNRYFVM